MTQPRSTLNATPWCHFVARHVRRASPGWARCTLRCRMPLHVMLLANVCTNV
jgi:hypothetical protein